MVVIKAGRKQTGWAGEFVCTGKGYGGGGCGATLLVEEGDLHFTSTGYGGETNRFIWFTCQFCQIATDIEVPHAVMTRVENRDRVC
jgi:hypothetical protein